MRHARNSKSPKPTSALRVTTKTPDSLEKALTGIAGLDEVTFGGLPRGRATLICGSPGCGKTMLGVEFLVNGARMYSEPGVFVAFEETQQELVANAASLKFDLDQLSRAGMLAIDHVHVDPNEIAETGDYDLEGLFIRLSMRSSRSERNGSSSTRSRRSSRASQTPPSCAPKFAVCFNS
jgi:replicative DNA helicase